MKKIYLFLMLLFCNAALLAQTIDWNYGANPINVWSAPTNWSTGVIPTASNIVQTANGATSFVDAAFTITRLQNVNSTTGVRAVNSTGSNYLTINTVANNANAIVNQSNSGVNLELRGRVEISNSTVANISRITNFGTATLGNANNAIVFTSTSTLKLTTPLEVFKTAVTNGANNFLFNGKIEGAGNLRVGTNAVATFGNTALSNAGYTGEIVQLAGSSIVVNTADNVIFYDGLKIQVNGTGASTTLNGENVFKSGISVGAAHTFGFTINKNQDSMTNIVMGAGTTINMAINTVVTNASFANNSANNWSTGILNITGFKVGVIRFGTNSTGLTTAQLAKITADGVGAGQPLGLDANGYLVLASTSWTGATSSDWTDASNWSNGVPNSTSNVTIGTGTFSPTIASNVAINSLAIGTGATLTVNEGNVLNVAGTITNSGDLILKSSATGTASLLNTSAAPNVTQQRFLSSNQRGWRLLSNPLTSTTFNALASASGITIGTNFTGEYLSASNTWTSTDGSAAMDNQKAYKVFITGLTGESPAYSTGPSNVTLVHKGTAANTAPAAIAATSGEFYLIANPYTAPISLKTILDANTFLSKTVSYYDPTVGSTDVKVKFGGYTTKDTSTSAAPGDANDVVIPPMGALFVQASAAGSITVPKTAIFTGTNNSGTYTHKTAQTKVASTNALKLEVSSNGVYYDALALQFKAVGDTGSNIDFGKLPNSILDAYSFAGSNKMAVSELELAAQTIPLGITSTIEKNYSFKVVENSIPAGYEAVLVDNKLNTSTVLTAGTTYNFAIDSNPASQGDARFAINLRTTGTLGVIANELDAAIEVYPNPSRGQFNITNNSNQKEGTAIEISNLNGQVIHTQKSNPGTTLTIQTKDWASGVYILKASNNGTQTTKKLIIQ